MCCIYVVDSYGYCINGVVLNKVSGKGISSAYILISGSERVYKTDTLGRFEICAEHINMVEVSHTSYIPQKVKLELAGTEAQKKYLTIAMEESVHTFSEVEIVSKQGESFHSTFTGNQSIQQKDILKLPTMFGEPDVIKAIQQLSGVQAANEGTGVVFVRGGSAGQNLFVLDDMEILNPSHLMGIYSVFNPLTTAGVELFKGNAPVQWQDHLSSAIIVKSVMPTKKNSGVTVNIGNISSSLALSYISKDERFTFSAGIRRSYLEALGKVASLFLNEKDNYFDQNRYSFYDINGSVRWRISNASSLSLSGYTGKDSYKKSEYNAEYSASTNWGNQALSLVYQYIKSPVSSFKHTLNYTAVNSAFNGNIFESGVSLNSTFYQWQQKNQWRYLNGSHLFFTGAELFYSHTIPQNQTTYSLNDSTVHINKFNNAGLILYLSDSYRIKENAELYMGMRFVTNSVLDPYSYGGDNISTNWQNIAETYYSLSPVVALSIFPKHNSSIKFAYSRNSQQVHLSSISSIPLPNDIWMASTPKIKPEKSHQLTAGYYQKARVLDYSVEAYFKYLDNQLIFNMNLDETSDVDFEDQFYKGKGMAYGLDFSISKNIGTISGAVNYSLSCSRRSFPEIMNGKWFKDKYDRTHDLKLNLTYQHSPRWDYSLVWVFSSGNMMTLPNGRIWMMGSIIGDYGGYNNFRLPAYHRLDISANCKLKVRKVKESVLSVSIINLYNRANPYYIFYKIKMDETQYHIDVKASQVSLFPIMPSISWRLKF